MAIIGQPNVSKSSLLFDLSFCACSVLFKPKGVPPGDVVEIARDNKHQGNIVNLMHYQDAPLANTSKK